MAVRPRFAFVVAIVSILSGFAWVDGASPTVTDLRTAFMIDQQPTDALTITAATKMLGSASPQSLQSSDEQQVTLVPLVIKGRVGARDYTLNRDIDPFLKGKASFFLMEIPIDAHALQSEHNSKDCAFCKRRAAKSPIVAVQFVDSNRQLIPFDSRELFGVQKGTDVIVCGTGMLHKNSKLPVPVIEFSADAIHVIRSIDK
ncbi:MAG: hypothetical protein NTX02_08190 [Planctomycetia bacterium]|nr:hypothetical protein [Planctomycetia bacterium]